MWKKMKWEKINRRVDIFIRLFAKLRAMQKHIDFIPQSSSFLHRIYSHTVPFPAAIYARCVCLTETLKRIQFVCFHRNVAQFWDVFPAFQCWITLYLVGFNDVFSLQNLASEQIKFKYIVINYDVLWLLRPAHNVIRMKWKSSFHRVVATWPSYCSTLFTILQ